MMHTRAPAMLVFVAILAWPPPVRAQESRPPQGAGWDELRDGRHEEAERAFEEALVTRPSDPLLHLGLGIASQALGQTDQARVELQRALDLEPRLTPAAALLGRIAYASGDLDGAISTYERALTETKTPPPGMQHQLDAWRAEAALHAGFEQQNGGRFTLLFEGPEERTIADHVGRVLESAYWRVGNRLNAYPGDTIPVILYTQQHFTDITRSPAWAAGVYDGRIRVAVQDALGNPAALDRVVTHELVHAFVQQLAPRGVPAWLHEGLAVNLEPGDHRWVDEVLRTSGTVLPLADLSGGFKDLNSRDAVFAYAESAAAARIVLDRFGPNLPVFLQSLAGAGSIDTALASFGMTIEDLESGLRTQARR
jgi:hypothetical protein